MSDPKGNADRHRELAKECFDSPITQPTHGHALLPPTAYTNTPLKFAVFGTAPKFRSRLGALCCEPSMAVCEFWRCRSSRKQPWRIRL
jgi:hypothetical protein